MAARGTPPLHAPRARTAPVTPPQGTLRPIAAPPDQGLPWAQPVPRTIGAASALLQSLLHADPKCLLALAQRVLHDALCAGGRGGACTPLPLRMHSLV